jgi:hypothetical protein
MELVQKSRKALTFKRMATMRQLSFGVDWDGTQDPQYNDIKAFEINKFAN